MSPLSASPSRPLRSTFATFVFVFAFVSATHAQQPMGTVATADAVLTGGLEVQNDRASLLSNVSVTARDRTAAITLHRGGEVLVCATSQFHLLHSGNGASLLFGLDRGAIEIHTASQPQDVILTPDIRFTLEAPGTFDLRLRVTRNGDTCIDNHSPDAPVLNLSDPFSPATYRLMPGQHILLEHGSLKEVVDNERDPCGCPSEPAPLVASAAGPHPFPAAVSQDLAPAQPAANTAPAGEKHTQIDTTFAYGTGPDGKPLPPPPITEPAPAPPAPVATAPPPTPPGAHDLAHAIGHFFHKLFHSGDRPEKPQKSTQ